MSDDVPFVFSYGNPDEAPDIPEGATLEDISAIFEADRAIDPFDKLFAPVLQEALTCLERAGLPTDPDLIVRLRTDGRWYVNSTLKERLAPGERCMVGIVPLVEALPKYGSQSPEWFAAYIVLESTFVREAITQNDARNAAYRAMKLTYLIMASEFKVDWEPYIVSGKKVSAGGKRGADAHRDTTKSGHRRPDRDTEVRRAADTLRTDNPELFDNKIAGRLARSSQNRTNWNLSQSSIYKILRNYR